MTPSPHPTPGAADPATLSERDVATFTAIVRDMPGNPGMWHHAPLFQRVLVALASRPTAVGEPADEDLMFSDANEVLCRVFDDYDEAREEWLAWYKPSEWLHGYRALGAFIRQRLDLAASTAVGEPDWLDSAYSPEVAALAIGHLGAGSVKDGTTLTAEQCSALLHWRKLLRDARAASPVGQGDEALRDAVRSFLASNDARVGSKSGRPDYGRFVNESDMWALHEAAEAFDKARAALTLPTPDDRDRGTP